MYPAPFEYHRAATVDEALTLLSQFGDDGKLIAGRHSLLPVMKLRFAQPAHLIDIRRVPELAGIREENGVLRIGATTTHAMASHWTRVRNSPSTIIAATATAAGSRLIRMLNTRAGMRRNAINSKL